jgi:hypothetical protein
MRSPARPVCGEAHAAGQQGMVTGTSLALGLALSGLAPVALGGGALASCFGLAPPAASPVALGGDALGCCFGLAPVADRGACWRLALEILVWCLVSGVCNVGCLVRPPRRAVLRACACACPCPPLTSCITSHHFSGGD